MAEMFRQTDATLSAGLTEYARAAGSAATPTVKSLQAALTQVRGRTRASVRSECMQMPWIAIKTGFGKNTVNGDIVDNFCAQCAAQPFYYARCTAMPPGRVPNQVQSSIAPNLVCGCTHLTTHRCLPSWWLQIHRLPAVWLARRRRWRAS